MTAEGAANELIVECADKETWPTFRECLECSRFRGYSFDAKGGTSFVSCSTAGQPSGPSYPHAGCAELTKVSAVMSDPICVRPEATLDEVAAILVARKISGLPVVDTEDRPVGMVSKTDLVEARAGGMAESALTARELMTPDPVTISEGATIAQAAALMAEKKIHRAPVIARTGKVVGIISSLDVARWVGSKKADGR